VIEGLAVYSESDWNKQYGRLGQSHSRHDARGKRARTALACRVNAEGPAFRSIGIISMAAISSFSSPSATAGRNSQVLEAYSGRWFPFRVHSTRDSLPARRWTSCGSNTRMAERALAEKRGREPDGAETSSSTTGRLPAPSHARGDRWYVQGNGYTLRKLMRSDPGRGRRSGSQRRIGHALARSRRGSAAVAARDLHNYNYYYICIRSARATG